MVSENARHLHGSLQNQTKLLYHQLKDNLPKRIEIGTVKQDRLCKRRLVSTNILCEADLQTKFKISKQNAKEKKSLDETTFKISSTKQTLQKSLIASSTRPSKPSKKLIPKTQISFKKCFCTVFKRKSMKTFFHLKTGIFSKRNLETPLEKQPVKNEKDSSSS